MEEEALTIEEVKFLLNYADALLRIHSFETVPFAWADSDNIQYINQLVLKGFLIKEQADPNGHIPAYVSDKGCAWFALVGDTKDG